MRWQRREAQSVLWPDVRSRLARCAHQFLWPMSHAGRGAQRHSSERAYTTVSWQLPVPEDFMTYKIVKIEGNSPQFAEQLET